MMEPQISDARRRAQAASVEAAKARSFDLSCQVCGGAFTASYRRLSCGPACEKERRLTRYGRHWLSRSKEDRRAERARIAAAKGKAYLTAEQRSARKTKRAVARRQQPPARRPGKTAEDRREYDRLRAKRRFDANPNRERARVSAYKKRNPEKNTNWSHRRRARLMGAFVAPVDLAAVKASRKTCLYCGVRMTAATASVDHIVAVALGGEHSVRNLVPACRLCNSRKQDKSIGEWLAMVPGPRRGLVERLCAARGISQAMLPLSVGGARA